jgi:arsenite methyltransferase
MTDTMAACCANLYELPIARTLLGASFHPGGPALTRELVHMTIMSRESLVLDLASGTGATARTLASEVGAAAVGIEYSKPNAAFAANSTDHLSCTFMAGDVHDLPLPDNTFDVVLCECALCTFRDQPRALEEAMRVLKPGGRFGVSDMTLEAVVPERLDTVMSHVLCIAGAHSVDGYMSLLDSAGFTNIRHHDQRHALIEMVDQIERNIMLAERLADAGDIDLPLELDDPRLTLAAARRFVENGGLSYSLFAGRKPLANQRG